MNTPQQESPKFSKETLPVLARAQALVIQDDGSLTQAGELLRDIKSLRKLISDRFAPIVKKAHEAHKAALEGQKAEETPLIKAEELLKLSMKGYMAVQDQIRKKEEERQREEARKKAEEEALAAAVQAEESGASPEEVQTVMEAPVFIPPPIAPAPPKLDGISRKKVVKFQVVDLRALVRAVASGRVPLAALQANEKVIRKQAESLRDQLRWDGVKVWEEDSLAAKGR